MSARKAIKTTAQVRLRNYGALGAQNQSRSIACVHPGNACRVGASITYRDGSRSIAYRHVYQET
ncbi:hypothetical protein [Dyella caseinilytica]|uniref:Uncharacterized protein n=1 Tax=Dyella caseinilytica TaxID=1849581 RepID=A0ABX7GPS4_9GAMM|nr:hypothetical protein [Dyella caseinilytica]QRN52421.1 hypothetical protein ISN74_13140 [Dyella caseinilytica]GGA05826.1 hypothetical protein GCM10011408_28480 [Dyella caseinilytica]